MGVNVPMDGGSSGYMSGLTSESMGIEGLLGGCTRRSMGVGMFPWRRAGCEEVVQSVLRRPLFPVFEKSLKRM